MKKALTGCLVVVLLAIVVGGGAAYWFIMRPAWDAGSAFIDQAKQWQQVAELDRRMEEYRRDPDPELARQIVRLRHDAFGRDRAPSQRESWPPELADPFPLGYAGPDQRICEPV